MAKAIIFDLDGVVIDTERSVWLTSSQELLAFYGKIHDEEKVGHLIYGTKFEDATRTLYDFYGIKDTFENFLEKRRQLVLKGYAENVTFMEGFENFYKRIGKYDKAVATSIDDAFLKLTLNHLPLHRFFGDHIYTIAQAGGRGKPHPDIFLYAAQKIGHIPAECIVIEDAPRGVEAAKAAGMIAIGLAKSVTPQKLSQADYVVDSFDEITEEMLHSI